MHADCAFWIGSTHRVCQDYGATGGGGCVVLADGCSSSPDTDLGARLLARSALRLLPDGQGPGFYDDAVQGAAACAAVLGLPPECLDATLLTVTQSDGTFTARCYGDGVIAVGYRDGRVEWHTVSFAANAPLYPSYRRDDGRRRRWEAQADNARSVRRGTLGPAGVTLEAQEQRLGGDDWETVTGDTADCRFVAVLSDGVQSFTRAVVTDTSRTTLPVTEAEVLADLLDFPGGRGEFVQRRAQAFRRHCVRAGWRHADDVALGVLWLDG